MLNSVLGVIGLIFLFGLIFYVIYVRIILKKETIATNIHIIGIGLIEGGYQIKFEYEFRGNKRVAQCETRREFELGETYRVTLELWREFSAPQIVSIIDDE